MATTQSGAILRHIRTLAASAAAQELTDGQLLHRFATAHEEAAFATLVQRHGRLVWSVCRHILHHEHDAEDAFQATFLILARRPGSIRKQESVGSWLYGVAYRVAVKAKRSAARRQAYERQARTMPQGQVSSELACRELQAILDTEVQRLPDKYRTPFVLCCLCGRSRQDVAQELGWKEGTVSSRIAQARKQLQQRLARQGITLAAVLCAHTLSSQTVAAAVPPALAQATIKAALLVVAGKPLTAAVISGPVAVLIRSGLRALAAARLKLVLALVLTVGGLSLLGRWDLGAHSSDIEEMQTPTTATTDHPGQETTRQAPTDRFGDPLPAGALARLGTVRFRHGDQVMAVAYSPDSKLLASGSEDNGGAQDHGLVLWEVPTGKKVREFRGHEKTVSSLAFTPDGLHLLSLSWDRTIRLWEVATGREIRRWPIQGGWQLALSPDGKTVAGMTHVPSGYAFTLWDVATGAKIRDLPLVGDQDGSKTVAFSPDGKTLASGGDRVLRLWDVATGKQLHKFGGDQGQIHKVVFSGDSKQLAVGSTDGTIRLWDVATAQEARRWKGNDSWVIGLDFSPDGKTLLSAGIGEYVRLWDVATGKELRKIRGAHQGRIWAVAFAPDGKTFAAGSEGCSVQVWVAATGKTLSLKDCPQSWPTFVAFLPKQEQVLLVTGYGSVELWDPATMKPLKRFEGEDRYYTTAALSPDGRALALGEWPGLRLADVATGKDLQRFKGHPRQTRSVAFAPGGKVLASVASQDRDVRLWDLATGKEMRHIHTRHQNQPSCVTYSPDGRTLASGGEYDHTICLWDPATGRLLREWPVPPQGKEGHSRGISWLVFSPDGRTLASAGADGTLRLWDPATGKLRRRMTGGGHLAFTPDGRTLISADDDRSVRLWETATGLERGRFVGHLGWLMSLAVTADGTRLATSSLDTTVLLWPLLGYTPPSRQGLATLSPQEQQGLWDDLASLDAPQAYRAMCRLCTAPELVCALSKSRLRATAPPDPKKIAQLVADLNSERFAVRRQATAELEQFSELAQPALRKVLDGKPTLEVRKRVEQLLEKTETGVPPGEQLRTLRAVEVLERVGTAEARQVLEWLARGTPEARVTQDARASLERLARR
jgi:RNA polymerase sigma factor (sigma-70 family)